MKYTTIFLLRISYLITQILYSEQQQQSRQIISTCSNIALLPSIADPRNDNSTSITSEQRRQISSYIAATQLAFDHLNERNTDVVSNLKDIFDEFCPNLYFNSHDNVTAARNLVYYDETYANTTIAELILHANRTLSNLCGMIGPLIIVDNNGISSSTTINDDDNSHQEKQEQIVLESSILARAIHLPQILTNTASIIGYAEEDISSAATINTIRNFISLNDYCPIVIDYCINELLIQYMLIVVPIDSSLYRAMTNELQRISATKINSDSNNRTVDYRIIPISNDNDNGSYRSFSPLYEAFNEAKNTGIRYIYIDFLNSMDMLLEIANTLYQLSMLSGDYFYILGGSSGIANMIFNTPTAEFASDLNLLLHGSIWIGEVDSFILDPKSDRFLKLWQQQQKQQQQVELNFDQQPFLATSYIYDSVITLGLGQCFASRNDINNANNKTSINDYEFAYNKVVRNIIENVSFDGASGYVKYKLHGQKVYRDTVGLNFVVYNIRAQKYSNNTDDSLKWENVLISRKRSTDESWTAAVGTNYSIQFADSTYVPPPQFAFTNMNYISDSVFVFGMVLLSLGAGFAVMCFCFVSYYEGDALLKISQPLFLQIICVGSVIEVCTIFTLSFDEQRGWNNNALDAMCIASKWFFFLGHATIYAAIFCKLWRVDRVMTARRRKVTYLQVIRPILLLFVAIFIVLIVWTVVDPLRWTRITVADVQPPESIGKCTCVHFAAFFYAGAALIGMPTFLTIIVVWRTQDVSQDLSDASLTFYLVVTQFQAWLLGIPVLAVLGEASIDAAYLSRVLLIWIFSVAPLLIVVCPSLYRTIQNRRLRDGRKKHRQRSLATGAVHVSGLNGLGSSTLTIDDKNITTRACRTRRQSLTVHDDTRDHTDSLTVGKESKESSSGYSDPTTETKSNGVSVSPSISNRPLDDFTEVTV